MQQDPRYDTIVEKLDRLATKLDGLDQMVNDNDEKMRVLVDCIKELDMPRGDRANWNSNPWDGKGGGAWTGS